MVIEVDCCRPKKIFEDKIVHSSILAPGDWIGVTLLEGKIRMAIVNSVDGDKGSILISGKTEKIRAFVYEDGYDEEGRRVDPTKPIAVRGRQIASIETKKCKPNRSIIVYPANL